MDTVIKQAKTYIQSKFTDDTTGHSWLHIERVWNTAKQIAAKEKNVNMLVVELGALFHEMLDPKLQSEPETYLKEKVEDWLKEHGVGEEDRNHILRIVSNTSFQKSKEKDELESIEFNIVQDADRLEALGAIGIARLFIYAGKIKEPLYDPENEETKTAIRHFHDKILRLKDLMNTDTAKAIAKGRHAYVEAFLKRFSDEWEGRK